MKRLSKVLHEKNAGKHRAIFLMAMLMAVVLSHARAEDGAHPAGDDMQQQAMPGMDDMNMQGMDMSPAEGRASRPDGSTLPAVRDPHAYADGYDFGPIPRPHFADEQRFASLLMDRLEWIHTSHTSAVAYDLQAWYGRDYDRAVLKAEGGVDGGKLQDARTELLWGHAVASFWDTQLGVRYDGGVDPGRGWLAFGVQGLAAYWFEVDACAYVGDAGHSALRLSVDYELLLTQRLILQPRLEANFYGKDDAARALGSGLSDLAAGIRLRYEIRREFAPYVGLEWAGKYGGTADYAQALGDVGEETRLVAGIRFWL